MNDKNDLLKLYESWRVASELYDLEELKGTKARKVENEIREALTNVSPHRIKEIAKQVAKSSF